ncbi:DNA methyltransferase [Sinorhizobium psoraleae]|uniref:Methyltransferase n=1 Tax=Sinorhizobium psoraleae TaxID=520838 RepID=A0ABT4KI37_9HYPH|nr:DNA methyltransferase [Sinorhizobium psoraleae]MCZ4090627.1 DNA methyltransferase [Sinorhizobium psoraleae]
MLLDDGTRRPATNEEKSGASSLPNGAVFFTAGDMQSAGMGREKGEGAASWFKVQFEGREYTPTMQSRWKTNEDGMRRLKASSRIIGQRTALRYLRRIDDFAAYAINNMWSDVGGASNKSYVVETAPRIVERCILMTTDPGDLVLDPTCGSGTTAHVAENWGRRWITIDTSRVALTLARARLMGAKFDYYHLADSAAGAEEESKLTGKLPAQGPFANDIRHGFVYRRTPHITLKSITNNAEIDVIWDRYQEALADRLGDLNALLSTNWDYWQVPREASKSWPSKAVEAHSTWWELRRARQKGH